MAVRLSTLPQQLPPVAHLHKINFVLPRTLDNDRKISDLVKDIFGIAGYQPNQFKGYGQRYQYNSWYEVKDDCDSVLGVIMTHGTGKFRDTTFVSLNGRCFETWTPLDCTIDVINLINYVFDQMGYFTRLDLAKNDYRRVTDWSEQVEISSKENFRDRLITRLNRTTPPLYLRQDAESIYYGSNKSQTQILVYKKQDKELTKFPWIRFETIIRGKAQCNAAAKLLLSGIDIDALAAGILCNLLDFKEPGLNVKSKRPSCSWWTRFVGTEKISLLSKDKKPLKDITEFTEIDF